MSLKRKAVLSLALILSATNAYAQYLPDIGYMGGAPGSPAKPQSQKSAPSAKKPAASKTTAPQTVPNIVGTYKGRFEGASEGEVDITGKAPRYKMSVAVFNSTGCAGAIDGPVISSSASSIVMLTKTLDGEMCRITMAKAGTRWKVAEDGACYTMHGAECSFIGSVTKAGK